MYEYICDRFLEKIFHCNFLENEIPRAAISIYILCLFGHAETPIVSIVPLTLKHPRYEADAKVT